MPEPATDPNALRRALEQVDLLRKELTKEKQRATHLKLRLAKLTADAKPQREQRAGG